MNTGILFDGHLMKAPYLAGEIIHNQRQFRELDRFCLFDGRLMGNACTKSYRNTLDEHDGGIGKVGYEINFNRVFFQYQPPRLLHGIDGNWPRWRNGSWSC